MPAVTVRNGTVRVRSCPPETALQIGESVGAHEVTVLLGLLLLEDIELKARYEPTPTTAITMTRTTAAIIVPRPRDELVRVPTLHLFVSPMQISAFPVHHRVGP